MVNVGLRSFLWETTKTTDQKVQRELWNLNGGTYEGYRAYIRYIKEGGFPGEANGGSVDVSRQPTTESVQAEASAGCAGGAASAVTTLYAFSGMKHIFEETRCAVHVVKFGRFSSDILAFAAADGCIYIAGTSPKQSGIQQVLRGHTGRVADLDWSADNAFLLSCGRDGDLCLWDADSGSLVRKWEQQEGLWGCPLACCRFHPVNQNLLFVGTVAGEVVALNSSTGLRTCRVPLQASALGGVGAACLEVTPKHLVVADSRGALHVYSCLLHAGQLAPPPTLLAAAAPPRDRAHEPACMEFLPHSALAGGAAVMVVDSRGGIVLYRLHDAGKGHPRLELKVQAGVGAQSSHKVKAELCPGVHLEQPEVVAMGGEDCRVHIYDISRHKRQPVLLTQLQGHSAPVLDVSWSFDESLLASSDANGTVIVWKRDPSLPATPAPATATAVVAAAPLTPVGS